MSGQWLRLNDAHVRLDAQCNDTTAVARALSNLYSVNLMCREADYTDMIELGFTHIEARDWAGFIDAPITKS